jgi:hypothetical protein
MAIEADFIFIDDTCDASTINICPSDSQMLVFFCYVMMMVAVHALSMSGQGRIGFRKYFPVLMYSGYFYRVTVSLLEFSLDVL